MNQGRFPVPQENAPKAKRGQVQPNRGSAALAGACRMMSFLLDFQLENIPVLQSDAYWQPRANFLEPQQF